MPEAKRSRRAFVTDAAKGLGAAAVASGFPAIVPASVFGAAGARATASTSAPSAPAASRAGTTCRGCGSTTAARIMAVCDLDSQRVQDANTLVNGHYTKTTGKPYDGVTGYAHYRELLANKDVDAVVISTPDHWHALIAIDAVRGRQGRLPAEAGVADHRRGARAEQRRPPVRTHLPDRQPAAIVDRSSATRPSSCATAASAS